VAEIRQSTATRGLVLHDLLVMASDSVMASAKRPPDDPPHVGVSPQKASDVVVAWPVTVRVHSAGDYVQLVELKFVPDLKSKALRTAVLRYDARHARAFARVHTGSSKSAVRKRCSTPTATTTRRTELSGADWYASILGNRTQAFEKVVCAETVVLCGRGPTIW
jgi:hypothetical protein